MLGWCHQVGTGWRRLWHLKLWDSAFREQRFLSLAGNEAGEQGCRALEQDGSHSTCSCSRPSTEHGSLQTGTSTAPWNKPCYTHTRRNPMEA